MTIIFGNLTLLCLKSVFVLPSSFSSQMNQSLSPEIINVKRTCVRLILE